MIRATIHLEPEMEERVRRLAKLNGDSVERMVGALVYHAIQEWPTEFLDKAEKMIHQQTLERNKTLAEARKLVKALQTVRGE